MKVLSIFQIACLFSTAVVQAITPPIDGLWFQQYTNTFVQLTTEIDWKCTLVNVTASSPENVTISKTASLHGGPTKINTTSKGSIDENQRLVIQPKSTFRADMVYDIHGYNNRTWILTGKNNPGIYVWTQSPDEPVDIAHLTKYLKDLGFNPVVSEYQTLINTYNSTLCST